MQSKQGPSPPRASWCLALIRTPFFFFNLFRHTLLSLLPLQPVLALSGVLQRTVWMQPCMQPPCHTTKLTLSPYWIPPDSGFGHCLQSFISLALLPWSYGLCTSLLLCYWNCCQSRRRWCTLTNPKDPSHTTGMIKIMLGVMVTSA